jgi:regulatory protein
MTSTERMQESYALNRLKELCSKSEKSEQEISKKLTDWGLESKKENIISILKKENYLNNTRFAHAFAVDKLRFNKWGKYKIKMLLRSKEIIDTIISDALSVIDDQEYRQIIFSELLKKKKSLKERDSYKLKSKIYSFGIQRGYESELINEFLSMKE